MKWTVNDIDMYLKSKEYVDTAVIPLIPVSTGTDIKSTAAAGEFISLITIELERQFKGRIILMPAFTYLKEEEEINKVESLKKWENSLKNTDLKNLIYITSDVNWKEAEEKLEETLIWLPTLPLENLDDSYRLSLIKDQMNQIMPIFINRWKQ